MFFQYSIDNKTIIQVKSDVHVARVQLVQRFVYLTFIDGNVINWTNATLDKVVVIHLTNLGEGAIRIVILGLHGTKMNDRSILAANLVDTKDVTSKIIESLLHGNRQ